MAYIPQREEGIRIVAKAVRSGIFNDLGSGSNVDVTVITKDKTEVCCRRCRRCYCHHPLLLLFLLLILLLLLVFSVLLTP